MDISQEFIDMCYKASEIQALRPVGEKYQAGDVFVEETMNTNSERKRYISNGEQKRYEWDVWIPRLDQLIDLIKHYDKKDCRSLINYLDSAKYGINADKDSEYNSFKTLDRYTLCFVMKESFNKIWDLEEDIWKDSINLSSDTTKIFDEEYKVWIEVPL